MTCFQEYHQQLLFRHDLLNWFALRGLGKENLAHHQIGFNNIAITIPIFDADGKFLFFKYRRYFTNIGNRFNKIFRDSIRSANLSSGSV